MKSAFPLAVSIVALFCAPSVQGAVLLKYDFTAGAQTGSVVDPGVTGNSFAAGPDLADTNNGTTGGLLDYTSGWARITTNRVIGASAAPGTEADSLTEGEYFTFTIGPNSGGTLNLESLVFLTAYYGTNAPTSLASFFVRTSIDNFAMNLGNTFTSPLLTSATFVQHSVSLAGTSFQDLNGPVEFRIYLYDTNTLATRSIAIDDVTINGTFVPAPEPTSCILVGASVALGALRRKRS